MNVFVLSEQNSIANHFLSELRDVNQQNDRLRFRTNMIRLGEIMAYEISKKMEYQSVNVQTPLKNAQAMLLREKPILLTVLRAGLPYFQGFLNYFDSSDAGFIGAYRKENQEEISIELDYLAIPSIENKQLVLIDPMLATGLSFIRTITELSKHGRPAHIYIASLVAAPEGIKKIMDTLKIPFTLFTVAIDEKLNAESYIVPGLGDAGDLSFGKKK
ncbi:MAG: uracil phosphoribosyltransferase [Cyclobacteriaceae bacterium]|nr:uracil phosphoribosyltransferase [Cyclobacteriaceae bacterium]